MNPKQRKVKKVCKTPETISGFERGFPVNENIRDSKDLAIAICKISFVFLIAVLASIATIWVDRFYQDLYKEKSVPQLFSGFNQHFGEVLEVLELKSDKKDEDNLEKLINFRLLPIKFRLTSLRTEIIDHEGNLYINKLSEPPFDFIQRTKLELENLGIDALVIDGEAGSIIGKMQQKSTKTIQLANQLVGKNQKILGLFVPWKLESLQKEGIFLVPQKWIKVLQLSRKDLDDRISKEVQKTKQSIRELVLEILRTQKVLLQLEKLFLIREKIEEKIFSRLETIEKDLSKLNRDQLLDKAYDKSNRDLLVYEDHNLILEHNFMQEEIAKEIKKSENFIQNVLLLEWKTSIKINEVANDGKEHSAAKMQYLKVKNEVEKDMENLILKVDEMGQFCTTCN